MAAPVFMDSWVSYGPRPAKDPEERWSLSHLLEDMDFCGISRALTRHEQMFQYDAMHINNRLIKEIQPHTDRLSPCWTALPHQFGDFPHPRELVKRMQDDNVQALYLQPATNGYPIDATVLGPLADALNPRRTLLLTTPTELGGRYEDIVAFCRIFSQCPVLLGEAWWNNWRLLVSVMDACPNTQLEFHLFQANRAVEFFADRYGIDRLVFGSGLLKHSAGAARSFIDYTLCTENQRNQFAGSNLLRLLKEDAPSVPRAPAIPDTLIESASCGKTVPVLVLDAHSHVLDQGLNGAGKGYVMIGGDIENMLALYNHIGIRAAAMMSWSGTVSMDVSAGNDLIEGITDAYPEQVIGLSSCDPTHQSAEEIASVCRRLHTEKSFCGLKPYYTNMISYAHPYYDPYWRFADEHRLYGLFHVAAGAGGIEAVKKVAANHKNMTVIIAHSGGSWAFARQVADAALAHANIMAELTLTPVPNGIIEWLCARIGSERVLFGTDAPMRDPRPQLGWCIYTRLGLEDKKNILGRNFARILAQSAPGKKMLKRITVFRSQH